MVSWPVIVLHGAADSIPVSHPNEHLTPQHLPPHPNLGPDPTLTLSCISLTILRLCVHGRVTCLVQGVATMCTWEGDLSSTGWL